MCKLFAENGLVTGYVAGKLKERNAVPFTMAQEAVANEPPTVGVPGGRFEKEPIKRNEINKPSPNVESGSAETKVLALKGSTPNSSVEKLDKQAKSVPVSKLERNDSQTSSEKWEMELQRVKERNALAEERLAKGKMAQVEKARMIKEAAIAAAAEEERSNHNEHKQIAEIDDDTNANHDDDDVSDGESVKALGHNGHRDDYSENSRACVENAAKTAAEELERRAIEKLIEDRRKAQGKTKSMSGNGERATSDADEEVCREEANVSNPPGKLIPQPKKKKKELTNGRNVGDEENVDEDCMKDGGTRKADKSSGKKKKKSNNKKSDGDDRHELAVAKTKKGDKKANEGRPGESVDDKANDGRKKQNGSKGKKKKKDGVDSECACAVM